MIRGVFFSNGAALLRTLLEVFGKHEGLFPSPCLHPYRDPGDMATHGLIDVPNN